MVDQRRFDNQRKAWLTAREASSFLGVDVRSLYAYVSRGLVRSAATTGTRARAYLRDDLERLRARQHARSGHGPVAAGALRWGEPVLDSGITEITGDDVRYRGRSLRELLDGNEPFERVATALWTGEWPTPDTTWDHGGRLAPSERSRRRPEETRGLQALNRLAHIALDRSTDVPRGESARARDLAAARDLVRAFALAPMHGHSRHAHLLARREPSIAGALAVALGGRANPRHRATLNAALVACADHELNVSTFAARVAASSGAGMHHAVTAALAAFSGPAHGGASLRVEALLREIASPARAPHVLRDRRDRGDAMPGFGHPLYPHGDPRASPLLAHAEAIAPAGTLRLHRAVIRAAAGLGLGTPNVDFALVSIADALGLSAGSAILIFAVGRTAGWIAHALEQREAGYMLRPRARFTGA